MTWYGVKKRCALSEQERKVDVRVRRKKTKSVYEIRALSYDIQQQEVNRLEYFPRVGVSAIQFLLANARQ